MQITSNAASGASTAPSTSAQVVIAGAGPVGLMLACELRLSGIDVLILEQRPTGTTGESRAPGINARTMELLAQRGLTGQFQQQGKPLSFIVFAGIPMDPHDQDPDWPDGWILPQHETERILSARAIELGVRIHWSAAVTAVEQDEHGVEVRVETPTGVEVVRGAYLVGCDGGRSTVRKATGIEFPGLAPETWWVVGDLDLADPPAESEPFGFNDTVGRYQLSRTEPGWFRFNMMRLTPPEDPSQPVTLDEVRATMIDGIGRDHGLRSARWMSRWSDGFRHATEYRRGRVLLAGDAAHTHTPIGGQGLNIGIQDAVNLGWKLAAVLDGRAPEDLLDTYHEERWPVAERVLTQSMGQTELVKPGRRRQAIRDLFEDLIALPETTRHLSGELSGLSLRYPLGDAHPLLGLRMPNLAITTASGETDVLTLLQDARALVITFTPARSRAVRAALKGWADHADHVTAQYAPDKRDGLWHVPVFGDLPPFDAVLVRPDGHVAWVAPAPLPLDVDGLLAAVTHRPVTEPAPDAAEADPAAGTWQISFTTPRGEQHAELVLHRAAGGWTGTYNGEPVTTPDVQNTTLTFTSRVREPFPTKVRWTGTIDGATITGKAKTSFMTLPFTATRSD
jgi:2-polyprenyl-6-methoxyphenol hydroxylase-like FAD-dependent oxidoreductase